jgi:adenine-specific DNA methylase
MDFFENLEKENEIDNIIKIITKIPSNYVGSKRRILRNIYDILENNNIEFNSVFDAFSGSAITSLLFKKMGKEVYCNDLLTSSAITAVCLLENESIPLSKDELNFLCNNEPKSHGSFVKDNYLNKFFTEKECLFLDRYKSNIVQLLGDKFYCGLDLLNKATLASIPNSNFSVYGKDLMKIRGVHDKEKSFWDEKWRDTTRRRRDDNNEIKFSESITEMHDKYKTAFSMFTMENHINQNCFLGGRYYNGQTIAKMEHRIKHDKSAGREITEIPLNILNFEKVIEDNKGMKKSHVFNSDIISLLESNTINTDLLYLDLPYGGPSSDYVVLYRFLEEYLYEDKLENLEHIQKGGKRFSRKKGYQEQFEKLLSLSLNFKTWLISYNESSYASLDTIKDTIRNAGKTNIIVEEVPITYQYRKGKNEIDLDQIKDNYFENGHKYTQRGTEYLILAQ